MKKFIKAAAVFAIALVTAASALFCAVPAQAATVNIPDPRIETATVTPTEPGVGSPLEVEFDFTHECNDIKNPDHVNINVTSETNSISVSQKEYKIDSNSIGDKDNAITFKLYIPQKYLKRTGNGYGILQFKITYYRNADDGKDSKIICSDDNNKKVSTFTVEKLVFGKLADSSKKDSEKTGRLTVQSFKLDRSPVKEGENVNLTLTVKNNGSVACNHVTGVITPPEGVSVNGVSDTKSIGTLAAGGTVDITYPLSCLSKMTTGNYAATVTLSADEMDTPVAPKVYIPVTGTKTDKTDTGSVGESKPQIIIESYNYGGQAVTGGKEFTLTMNIKNTGTTAIENIKMTVSSVEADSDSAKGSGGGGDSGAFTPSKSSNTFFINKLGAGAVIKKEIALLPKSDASPNSYGVGIAFKYEAVVDKKRQSLDADETITIPLTQPDRFEVNDVEVQDPCCVGQPGQFTANYVNKGKSKIFNLSVVLNGDFTTSDKNTYIGNIDSGASDDFEATITPTKEGTLNGTVTFSYEDSSGNVKKIEKAFTGEVSSVEDMKGDMGGMDGMDDMGSVDAAAQMGEAKKGGVGWKVWVGGAAGIIIIIVVLRIVLKKRKAKKMRILEESDDYDDEPGGGKGI